MLDIDHHLGNSALGGLNYVIATEASTGTCVLRLLHALDVTITPEIATCILTTIMTDTGAFMHTNTTAPVLRMSAEMLELGADKPLITEEIFANKRFAATKLLGMALERAVLETTGDTAGRTSTTRCCGPPGPTARIPKRSCNICARSKVSRRPRCSRITKAPFG